jgi:hypothetical protein
MIFTAPTLTRNWFRSSDIAAALLVSLVERRRVESLWWYNELVESLEFPLLDTVFLEAWLLCGTLGLFPPTEDRLLVLDAILLRPRGPLFAISIIAHNRVPCILQGFTTGCFGSERPGLLGYFDRAVGAKNIVAAAWAAIRENGCDPMISRLAEEHFSIQGFTNIESILLAIQHVLYPYTNESTYGSLDLRSMFPCNPLQPFNSKGSLTDYNKHKYPHKQREWVKKCPELPKEIAYFTNPFVSPQYDPFWNFSANTIRGSPYWDSKLKEYGLIGLDGFCERLDEDDKTEAAFQELISECAPDDIPDEWSEEDRNKLTILNRNIGQLTTGDWKVWLSTHLPTEFLEQAFSLIEDGSSIYSYRDYSTILSDADKKFIRPAIIRSSLSSLSSLSFQM